MAGEGQEHQQPAGLKRSQGQSRRAQQASAAGRSPKPSVRGCLFYAAVVADLLKEQAAARQAPTHDHYLAERRARQEGPRAWSPMRPRSPIAKANRSCRSPSSRPRGSAAKLMSDIDAIPACSEQGPAAAGPAPGTGSKQNLRLQIIVDGPGSSALQRLASVEALQRLASVEALQRLASVETSTSSPSMITRSQSSEVQADFFSLSLHTPSGSERPDVSWDGAPHPPF